MIEHAKLSASGSSRWLNCPGSVKAEEGYPNQPSSAFALEGTRAHEVADLCLKASCDADVYIGKKVLDDVIDAGMAGYVQEYLDYVRSYETATSKLFTEERVDFSHVVPGGFGTLDAAVLDYDTKTCHIFDLKYGKGVKVDAFENTQAQMYAIGLESELSFLSTIDKFVLHIVQPRIYNFSSWEISTYDLLGFSNWVAKIAAKAVSGEAERSPGEKQCQWCKAKGDCKALSDFTTKIITSEFDDLDDLDVDSLNDGQKKTILDNKKLVETFLKAVEASVFDQLDQGVEFNGYKLVEGRSIRKWNAKAEHKLIRKLGTKAYSRKLIGIGAAEKELGKDFIKELTIKPEGKPTLAPSSDKRSAIDSDLFEKIN
jgi:hypothetical protein